MNEPSDPKPTGAPDDGSPPHGEASGGSARTGGTTDEARRRASPLLEQERLAWLHERSGEFELLISGALLFGLLQVPGQLESWWDTMSPSLSRSGGAVVFLLYFYARVMAVTLISAFSLHLVTRAYWVGLVGLDSVFPEGVDWERVNYGPVAKDVYRERLPTLPQLIRKADDFGSMIFSVAFLVVIIFVFSIGFGLVFGALGWGLHATLLPGVEPTLIVVAAAVSFGVVPAAAIGLERLMGDRIRPGSAPARVIERLVAFYYRGSGGALYLPIQFTLFSRIKKTIVWPAAIAIVVGLMLTLMFTELSRSTGLRLSADGRLPERAGRRAVASDHFADARAAHSTAPYIQSDIVEGPYVRLTVPLSAVTYGDRLTDACPDLPTLAEGATASANPTDPPPDVADEARLLDCLGRIWSVTLDGRPLTIEWDLSWTRRGADALLAYVPTRGLASGAHLLEVTRAARAVDDDADFGDGETGGGAETAGDAGGEENRPARYFIRFRI